ncbi:MAG: surface layer protein, partial [Rhizobiales bacterium]|nr:surface layer protein [Hyphomicrobiales bacterium]
AAFHDDGTTLLVANQRGGTISVIDLLAMHVRDTFAAGVGCETLAYI